MFLINIFPVNTFRNEAYKLELFRKRYKNNGGLK
jgi:hypothetical protein